MGVEAQRSGPSIVKHALATQVYTVLSDFIGAPYLAHPLRSHFNSFDALAQTVGLHPLMSRILEVYQQSRRRRASVVRPLFDERLITIHIPPFLAMVLSRTDSAKDIGHAVMELRNSRAATKFREWLLGLSKMAIEGKATLGMYEKELKRVQRLVGEWGEDPTTKIISRCETLIFLWQHQQDVFDSR